MAADECVERLKGRISGKEARLADIRAHIIEQAAIGEYVTARVAHAEAIKTLVADIFALRRAVAVLTNQDFVESEDA